VLFPANARCSATQPLVSLVGVVATVPDLREAERSERDRTAHDPQASLAGQLMREKFRHRQHMIMLGENARCQREGRNTGEHTSALTAGGEPAVDALAGSGIRRGQDLQMRQHEIFGYRERSTHARMVGTNHAHERVAKEHFLIQRRWHVLEHTEREIDAAAQDLLWIALGRQKRAR
jgi:hypothetical protein